MRQKISVIMANYNCEKYIGEAIESIINQTFKEWELIIIDDKSSDNSVRIIRNYQKRDKRIKLITNKKNIGAGAARNKGLNVAKGEYIAILDSDDISLPERLNHQYNFLENHKEIFLVGGDIIEIDDTGHERGVIKTIKDEKRLLKKIENSNQIMHPTIMFRNDPFSRYREKMVYAQDYDFYLNCVSNGKRLLNMDETFVKYRIRSDSISLSKRAKQDLFAEKAREFFYQRRDDGVDVYSNFRPKSILKLDLKNTDNPKLLFFEIKGKFHLGDMKETRRLIWRYVKKSGFFINPKIYMYYLLSFLNTPLINLFRKIKTILYRP